MVVELRRDINEYTAQNIYYEYIFGSTSESSEMFISSRARAGGGVIPVYGLYRYVQPQKGMALNCFGQKGYRDKRLFFPFC